MCAYKARIEPIILIEALSDNGEILIKYNSYIRIFNKTVIKVSVMSFDS